jgi:DNA-binding transcriptional LysR family regulator
MSYLVHLRSFLAVWRHSSISKAARALHLTQPAVSRHIKTLEARLGRQLFERLPRGLASTPAANELERRVAPHLDALEAALGTIDKHDASGGRIRVGAIGGFARPLLAALSPLAQRGVHVELSTTPPPMLLQALAEQSLDLVITPARIPHKGIDYDVLYEGALILVCAPRWRARVPKSAAPRGLPLIELDGPFPALPGFWRAAFGATPEAPAMRVGNWQDAIDAAVAGVGLAVAPECLCAAALDRAELIAPRTKPGPRLTLFTAVRKGDVALAHVATGRRVVVEAAGKW